MYISYDVDVGTGGTMGRAPRTRETLPDFRESCQVTRHSPVFHGLTGCQRTPGFWGVTALASPSHCFDLDFALAKEESKA